MAAISHVAGLRRPHCSSRLLYLASLILFCTSPVVSRDLPALVPSNTFFAPCAAYENPPHVFSPVSVSQDRRWRAYVEVQSKPGCLYTTRLWVAKGDAPYRVVYLIPPEPYLGGNGMELLGWAPYSNIVLVKTIQFAWGSDAMPDEQVLGVDAATGMIYKPDLGEMLASRRDKQCVFTIVDAGFSRDPRVTILVRAHFRTAVDEGETIESVPPEKRCTDQEETWSFSLWNRETKQVEDTAPLLRFTEFVPNKHGK